jgi:1-acyl-sn-glycerol-3-phosphate acyltransferase
MGYFIGWCLFRAFFKLFLDFKVIGRENVPKRGAFLFVSNHTSFFDPILLGTSLYRSLNYMARDTLFKTRCSAETMRTVHAFPLKRGRGDLSAIREALRILGMGKPLVIFPEGTRAKDKHLRRAKPGAGFIAVRSGVPVIPAYVWGSFDALPRGWKTFRPHPVRVYIGKPVDVKNRVQGPGPRGQDKEVYQCVSDEMMKRIGELKEKAELENSR